MTEIISEIGVNWSCDIDIAEYMILKSKEAGADCVKFQMFNEDVIKDSKHKNELMEMILDEERIKRLYKFAKHYNIKFGVSTMYKEAFDILKSAGVVPDFIKIRYADRKNEDLACLAVNYCFRNNVQLIVSCDDAFIGSYVRYDTTYIYKEFDLTNFMYCVPLYPPDIKEISINKIEKNYFHGYSNHYPSKFLPMIAVNSNKEFIEIHVKRNTHNNVAVGLGLVKSQLDENVSLSFEELKDVCDFRNLLLEMR